MYRRQVLTQNRPRLICSDTRYLKWFPFSMISGVYVGVNTVTISTCIVDRIVTPRLNKQPEKNWWTTLGSVLESVICLSWFQGYSSC